mgnify:CR=1 FL=1
MTRRSIHLLESQVQRGRTPPIDVVITWVDDRTPGYREMLKAHAKAVPDLDPARTRDTLAWG